MAYVDYSSQFVLDQFLTYLNANQLGANCEHLYDTIAVEHNINASTVDGTHKSNSITGGMINTTPTSTGSQVIAVGATWTPTVGVYQMVNGQVTPNSIIIQIYISGSWRGSYTINGPYQNSVTGIMFFDGTNMRLQNVESEDSNTVWYQKF